MPTSFIPMVCEEVESLVELPQTMGSKLAPPSRDSGAELVTPEAMRGYGASVFGKYFKGLYKTYGPSPRFFAAWNFPPNKELMQTAKKMSITRAILDQNLDEKQIKEQRETEAKIEQDNETAATKLARQQQVEVEKDMSAEISTLSPASNIETDAPNLKGTDEEAVQDHAFDTAEKAARDQLQKAAESGDSTVQKSANRNEMAIQTPMWDQLTKANQEKSASVQADVN